jgi:hypothetical protein
MDLIEFLILFIFSISTKHKSAVHFFHVNVTRCRIEEQIANVNIGLCRQRIYSVFSWA